MFESVFVLITIPVVTYALFNRRNNKLEDQILTVLIRYGEKETLEIINILAQDFDWKVDIRTLKPCLDYLERDGLVASHCGEELSKEGSWCRYYYFDQNFMDLPPGDSVSFIQG